MSWVVEEWKEGLSTRALQKIQELESQLDKLKKERQQRQFQLESLEAALQKQKQKVENEKNEGATLKRENQSLMELCDNLEKTKQKISHDLQVKESQVNYQVGQLNSSKKQIEILEQELKRYKSELERSQQTLITGDLSFNSTPQKNFTAPLTPSQNHNDSKFEELQEKYNKEVEERKRLEAELRNIQVKKINHSHPQSTMNHREIARHQASSSVFSWQQENIPSYPSSSNQETPLKRAFTSSHFPWEQEATPSHYGLTTKKTDFSSSFSDSCGNSSVIDQLKTQNQELSSKVQELEHQLRIQEKEIKSHKNKLQEVQFQLEKTKLELREKDSLLHKNKDELNRMTAQCDQATAQYEMVEQKMKKLSEELNCQRQNVESARLSLEQKVKEKEKEYQKELFRQQHSFQTLDQQCNQIQAKLNQELQQAKNDYNALRAEFDKAIAVNQRLENDFSELTQKLCRAEQALLANQSKENDLRRNFEDIKMEKNLLSCQSDKKSQEIRQLEEELKIAKQFLKESQNYAEEMKNKSLSQEEELKILQEKLNKQDDSLTLEKLKLVIADLEKQRDSIQLLVKQRENHTEELKNKLGKMEKESEALLKVLELKERECEELKKEFTTVSHWNNENEQLVNKLESEKEGLLSKIYDLESSLKIQQVKSYERSETVRIMVNEREKYCIEIKNLRDMVEYKSAKLEAQQKAYDELKQKAECSDQKYRKEIENMTWKISQLTNQVEILEQKPQLAANEVLEKDQCYHKLYGEYERICLVKSKDTFEVTEDRELHLQNSHCRTVLGDEQLMNNSIMDILMREPGTVTEDQEDRCRKAVLESDKNDQQDMSILQDQVSSRAMSLMAQKQFDSVLEKPYEELVQIKDETEERLAEAEQMHESFVTETTNHISDLQENTSVYQHCADKTLAALKEKDKHLQTLNKELETQQAEIQDLKINNKLLEDSIKQLRLVSDTWVSEKKDMRTILSLHEKETDLIEENGTLKSINKALEQEKVDLLETNIIFSNSLKEQEKSIAELSKRHKEERLSLMERYEEIEKERIDLQGKYKSIEEKNANTESILRGQTSHFQERKAESERQEKQFRDERNEFFSKLMSLEGENKDLIQELERVRSELKLKQAEIAHIQNESSAELDCLRQEMLNVRAEQNKMQEQHIILLQENEQLNKVIKTKNESLTYDLVHETRPASEQLRESMEEKENELNKYHVKLELLQMDLEDREVSVENYSAQVIQLEAALKSVVSKLDESEKEKERMQQELQTIKEKWETPDPKLIVVDNDQSLESVDDAVSEVNCKRTIHEKYSLVLHELTSSQNDDVQLVSSLQMAMNRLNELEKMCEMLRIEKLALISELNDSKTEYITTDKMEEVERIVSKAKILKDTKAIFPDELMDQSVENEMRIHFDNEQMSFKSLECSAEPNYNYEDLKLFNKEVKMHFAEVKEKFFSLQSEHKILHEQHCNMVFKMSQLQSYIETLKAENSVLSTSQNKVHADSVDVQVTSSQTDGKFKLDETESTFSPSYLNVMPCSTEANLVQLSFDSDLCKWREETIWPNISQESALGDATEISLIEEPHNDQTLDFLARRESIILKKSNLESKIKELQILCQTYEKSIKRFEEQFQSHENMKDEEIQELKQIILSERKELDDLRKQNISDNEQWQEKLNNVTIEMEYKLAAEKKQIEHLSLELEVARLQLQGLDLSSHSLLRIDVEDLQTSHIEQENNGLYQLKVHSLPDENLAPKRAKPEIRLCEQITIEENSECEKITEVTKARSAEERPAKMTLETEYRNTSEKDTGCHTELSFSNHNISTTPVDFLENQETIETLQLHIKQTSSENMMLLHGTEESNKNVDALLMEIKELNSKLYLHHTELTAKITAYAELEKTVLVLKKGNSDLNEKLESVSFDKQQMFCKVMILEKELDKAKSDLDLCKVRLSDVTDMLEDLEMTKGEWHEKFLETENELRRTRSVKEKIETHALSMEGDIEELQIKNQQLEKDSENKLKTMCNLQEQLAVITTERNQLSQELSVLSENKEELDQLYKQQQENIKELESNKVDSTEFIRILEAEAKAQTKLLQTTKSDIDQLARENGYLVQQLQNVEKDAEILTLEKEKLHSQAEQVEEEKELILRESEMLQTKLNVSEMENSKLAKTLEGSLIEKGELAARLNSTQEEVDQLRHGIEKLKVKIESDEKKKRHTAEKLRESERKADFLLDKIQRLERELQMSEENLEDAILRAETANAETETLKIEMEQMSERLKSLELTVSAFRSAKESLNKELQEKQEKICELESSNSNIVRLLEEKAKENKQIKEESENITVLIKSQLKNAGEKIKLSYNELEICKAKGQDLIHQVDCLEHDKTQLSQELQETRNISTKLEQSLEVLVQELADCKQKLDEKIQENGALQKKIKDLEQLTSQLSLAESEHECWKQEKGLQNLSAELKQKVQCLSNNEILQTTLESLTASHKDLEKELESTWSEKSALAEKVQLDPTTLEKIESNKGLDKVQKELEEKEREMKKEISEYQSKLHQVEKNYQAFLAEASRKNELEIQACQEKLNSLEQCLDAQKLEMEVLKSSKEELNHSLKDANQTIEELKKAKADNLIRIVQLKKANEFARSKMQIWMKSCKQLEQEKEILQKQIVEHESLLKKQKPSADEVASVEEMRLKLEELKESIEEKTKEAEENLEKYCTLIVNHDKLEEENEMLKTQVSLLSAQVKQLANAVNSPSQNSDNPLTLNDQSVTEKSDEDPSTKLSGKRQRCQEIKKDDGEPKSPISETLSKKIKKGTIYQYSLTHENTEYEPDGLPEVVKKGFADIPVEKISPYVLRRTTLNLRTSPCHVAQSQKLSPCTQSLQKGRSDNRADISRLTAGGRKSQKVHDMKQYEAETALEPMESTSRSPLCVNKQSTKAVAENSTESLTTHEDRCSLNTKTLLDQNEQGENCMVQ